jgi:hypothetical protein
LYLDKDFCVKLKGASAFQSTGFFQTPILLTWAFTHMLENQIWFPGSSSIIEKERVCRKDFMRVDCFVVIFLPCCIKRQELEQGEGHSNSVSIAVNNRLPVTQHHK